jgi:hypothetical protein
MIALYFQSSSYKIIDGVVSVCQKPAVICPATKLSTAVAIRLRNWDSSIPIKRIVTRTMDQKICVVSSFLVGDKCSYAVTVYDC